MAAVFITLQGNDVFKSAGSASSLITIPSLDGIVGREGLAIYTDVSVQIGETIQYFMTFDDVIKFIHFGKGIGNITANGMMFCDKDGDLPSLKKFFSSAISELRGKDVQVVVGTTTFTAVMTAAQVNVLSEPDTMAQFQVNFSIVNHTL